MKKVLENDINYLSKIYIKLQIFNTCTSVFARKIPFLLFKLRKNFNLTAQLVAFFVTELWQTLRYIYTDTGTIKGNTSYTLSYQL